jgi:hypothetical protein
VDRHRAVTPAIRAYTSPAPATPVLAPALAPLRPACRVPTGRQVVPKRRRGDARASRFGRERQWSGGGLIVTRLVRPPTVPKLGRVNDEANLTWSLDQYRGRPPSVPERFHPTPRQFHTALRMCFVWHEYLQNRSGPHAEGGSAAGLSAAPSPSDFRCLTADFISISRASRPSKFSTDRMESSPTGSSSGPSGI